MLKEIRTAGDAADLAVDIVDTITGLPFDGSAHSWALRVQTLANYESQKGTLTFDPEIAGTYTYSAGTSGYVTFSPTSAQWESLVAGTDYVFEVWYYQAGASPAKPVFAERWVVSIVPRNFKAAA